MGMQTKTIGRMPTNHGQYDPQLAYGKKFIVTLFDCGWESKHDNNTSAPATLNAQAGTITENTTDWKKKWGSYKQWLIDNDYQKMDASKVKDDNNTQHDINAAFANEIGSDSTPESIKGRITNLEEAVGSGGSVDERIAEEGAKHYLKSETYNKEEVNNLITTPNQEYVSVTANAQTTDVTDVLPSTGASDTTYRVGNWDGTQYNESEFSEYAWNGSAYIKLSTKSQVGEVYDISANHADAKYADLAAALNGGANIPQSLQKGGMSVKFVQSSDNKYVQYRLMSDTWSITPSDWQGVDDEPVAGSDNLVKSGGVENTAKALAQSIVEAYKLGNFIRGIYVNTDDVLAYNKDYCFSDKIPVTAGDSLIWYYGGTDTFTMRMVLYDNNGNELDNWVNNAQSFRYITIPQSGHVCISFLYANLDDVYVSVNNETVYTPQVELSDIKRIIDNINNSKVDKMIFKGNNTVYVSKKLYGLIPGNTYRLAVKSTLWQHTSAPANTFILGVESYLNASDIDLVVVRQGETVLPYYDFQAIENDYVEIGVRADVGESVIVELTNITSVENINKIIKYYETDLNGNNASYVSKTQFVEKGKYIVFLGGTWGKENIGNSGALFVIESSGKTYARCNANNMSDLQDYYLIEFTEDCTIEVGARADVDTEAKIFIVNVDYIFQYLNHNDYVTEFDKADGKEFLFLGKSFVQANCLSNGGLGAETDNFVSLASLLEVPYPKAKLKFKLPNYVVAKLTFGDYSFQLNSDISWISNGQTVEIPEKVLYYRLTFARTNVIKPVIGESISNLGSRPISVAEILNYINKGEISIIYDNTSVFSANSLQEQYLKVCMRKYTADYMSDRDKGFNYFPTILHLTDVHGDVTRMRRALQYAKMLNVETVVLTGDIVCGDTRNDATFVKDIEDETGISIYPCVGNHDSYGTSIYDNGGAIGINPAYRQWNTITKNVLTKAGVVSPAGVDYPTYYHYDNTTRKLRYIFVNLYEKGRDYTYSGALYVSSEQINWLISTLASTPQDYGVIVLMHQAETGITKDTDYAKFYGVEYYTPQTKISGAPIMKIVDAFIGKTSVSDSYTQYINGIDGEQETIQYSADFSSVASGVEFIAYLTGHEHFDKIGYVTGATHRQLMLNITCTEAGYGNNYVSAANISELPRGNGSTQDAITIYVIDREDKKIRLARLGSIITSKFEMRDYMVIPYV